MVVAGVVWFFIFGLIFAWRIYVRPIYPTWLSVFLGTAATLVGITAVNIGAFGIETGLWASFVAWLGFAITGGFMIFGQVRKGEEFVHEAQVRAYQTGRLAGTNDTTEETTAPH